MNKSRLFLFIVFGLIFLISRPCKGQDQNVILILCDDLKYFDFADQDCPVIAPNLKMLAENAISFSNAHANSPICSPSRASLLSGKYAQKSGYFGYDQLQNHWYGHSSILPDSSIFAYMKENGYETLSVGKVYHNGHDSLFLGIVDSRDRFGNHGPFPYKNGEQIKYPGIPEEATSVYQSAGPIVEFSLQDSITWRLNPIEYLVTGDSVLTKLPDENISQAAADHLSIVGNQKFFMALGFYRPHSPFYVPKKYYDLYDIDSIIVPEFTQDEILLNAIASFKNSFGSYGEGLYASLSWNSQAMADDQYWIKRWIQAYYASLTFVDEQIGTVLNALNSSDYAQNTMVIVTSDNGYNLGEYSKISNKNILRQSSSRIPFFIYGNEFLMDTIISEPISLIDIYPTIAHYTTGGTGLDVDGNSILPLINSSYGSWNGNNFALSSVSSKEVIPPFTVANNEHQHYSLSYEDHRYNLYSSGEEELFDRTIDPNEKINLAYLLQETDLLDSISSLYPNAQFLYPTLLAQYRANLSDFLTVTPNSFDPLRHLVYGDFEQELNGWTASNVDPSNSININYFNPLDFHCVLHKNVQQFISIQNNSLFLEEGHDYNLIFNGKFEDTVGDVKISLGFKDDNQPLEILEQFTFELNDQWNQFIQPFSYNNESTKRKAFIRIEPLDLGIAKFDDFEIIETVSCQPSNFQEEVTDLSYSYLDENITLSWSPIQYTGKCEVQRNVSSAPIGSNFSDLIPEGLIVDPLPPTESVQYSFNVLLSNGGMFEYDTEYRWRVRCGCSIDPLVVSPFSNFEYFTIPQPTSVDDKEGSKYRSKIFPNPNFESELTIDSKDLGSIFIYNSLMQLISMHTLDKTKQIQKIDIGELDSGPYFLELHHEDHNENMKLIVQ